mgnify:CR=1 FL=1
MVVWMIIMMLLMLLVAVLVIFGAVSLVHSVFWRADTNRDHAHDSLRERFARGEIDETEYRERRRVLGSERDQ